MIDSTPGCCHFLIERLLFSGGERLDTGRDLIETPALAHALADAYQLRVIGLLRLERGSINTGYHVAATDGDYHLKCYDGRLYQTERIHRSLDAQ